MFRLRSSEPIVRASSPGVGIQLTILALVVASAVALVAIRPLTGGPGGRPAPSEPSAIAIAHGEP